MPDGQGLLVSLVPEGRGPAPEPPRVPAGPNIRETSGKAAKVATYQDLLKSASDEALFEYYAAAQLAVVDIASGRTRKIGKPGIFADAAASPDASCFLVDRVKKPYSYSVPYYEFAHAYEVWDREGALIACPADLPPADTVPMNGVPTGPRDMDWLALKPATLVWFEALDDGDPEKEAPFRDRVMTLAAPFTGAPAEVFRFKDRAQDLAPLATPGLALASEFDWKKRWRTTWLVNLDQPGTVPRKIFERNAQDRYNDPGSPVWTILKTGERVVLVDKDRIYLSGAGASPKGDHPFLDRLDLGTLKNERLFQCQDPAYEDFVAFLGASRRESPAAARIEDRAAQLFPLRSEEKEPEGPDGIPGPGAPAHGSQEGARHLQARGRRRALRNPLSAARIQARDATARGHLGLSSGIQ